MLDTKIIGKSEKLTASIRAARLIATTNSSAMIYGETGTGKELLARFIHLNGLGAKKPFITVTSSNLHLFDRLFQGAAADRKVEKANKEIKSEKTETTISEGSTIFFDEIGNFSLEQQASLLRFFDSELDSRFGKQDGGKYRLVITTHHNLASDCQRGTFRKDLFYRIDINRVDLAPLRERSEDIPDLLNYFVEQYGKVIRPKFKYRFSPKVLKVFLRYHWPGNVRELKNMIRTALLFSQDRMITERDLRFSDSDQNSSPDDSIISSGGFYEQVNDFRRKILLAAVERSHGNITDAARRLKMSRPHLHRLLKSHQA